MDAHKRMIVSDILSKDNVQFIIPIYQREYKWTPLECNRIVNDILSCGKTHTEHFIGSIVYQYTEFNMININLYLVDGQQRLTTLMLITKALNLIASSKRDDDDDYEYVFNKTKRILYIDTDDRKRGYSLYPSENDRDVFNLIVSAKNYEDVVNNSVIPKENYMLNNFINAYKKLLDAVNSGSNIKEEIYNGFLNLSVVEIIVSKDENAQVIFESINSLGVKLTNAELIQNYLLMSNANQEHLYVTYWKPMKNILIGEKHMESFVKDYLLMKLEYQFNDDDVYKEYTKFSEKFVEDGEVNREEMIVDLYQVAEIYEPFLKESSHFSRTTNRLMKEFRDMDQTTCNPFLMRVFLDYKNHVIDEETLNKTINLILVYVVRRLVCGVATHTLRGFMMTLYKRIFKVKENYERYYESVYAFLSNIRTNDTLRSEIETLECLKTFGLYRNVKFATFVLNCLENGRYPKPCSETIVADKISVEHIMPQTLTDEWMIMLGENTEEIHLKYLNTLGNLSLSSRAKNSIMSNESFAVKKEVLKAEKGKFVELNLDIDKLETFGEKEIIDREARLAEIFAEKFRLEPVNTEGIKFEENVEIICDGEYNPVFQSSTILSYSLLGVETNVNTFAQLIISVAKQLYSEFPEKVRVMAAEHFNPWNNDSIDCVHFGYGPDDRDPVIADDIRVHLGYNSPYCIQFCEAMITGCDLEPDQLSVFLRKDSIKGDSGVAKSMREEKFRQALKELSDEGIINYNPAITPKSHTYLSFLIDEITEALDYQGEPIYWTGDYYKNCCFVEYSMTKQEMYLSFRNHHDTKAIAQMFKDNKDVLKIDVGNDSDWYWHLKTFAIDQHKILDSEDIIGEIKRQFMPCLEEMKEMGEKVREVRG